jgi:hypothetical protein
MTLTDIDEPLRDVALRVQRGLRAEHEALRAAAGTVPRRAPAHRPSPLRWWLPAVAVGAAAAIVAVVTFTGGGHDQAQDVDTVDHGPPEPDVEYFLPPIPDDAQLDVVAAPGELDATSPVRWVRSYRQPGTDRFVVVQTTDGSTQSLGTPVDLDGTPAQVVTTPGVEGAWIYARPTCATATIVGRNVTADETVAAARTIRCEPDGTVALDPDGYERVYDGVDPWSAPVRGSVSFSPPPSPTNMGLDFAHVGFSDAVIDVEQIWLASVDSSTLEWIERGGRTYGVISSIYATTIDGVPGSGTSYEVVFEEHDTLVSVSKGFAATKEEVLALADSVQRVDEATFRALAERRANQWRKPAYFVPDVVPEGLLVRAMENRQMIGFNIATADWTTNYSVGWQASVAGTPGFGKNLLATHSVAGRTVEVYGYEMAVPPPNGEPPTGQTVGLRDFVWQATPDVRITVSVMSGPEADADILAIVGGLREVSEAEWKAYLDTHDGG